MYDDIQWDEAEKDEYSQKYDPIDDL